MVIQMEYILLICIGFDIYGLFCYDYTYIGCYKDQSIRTLNLYPIETWGGWMSTEMCVNHWCTSSPLITYFGTEAGFQCFCGDQKDTTSFVQISPFNCKLTCTADSTQICGGVYSLSLYSTACTTPLTTTENQQTTTTMSTAKQFTGPPCDQNMRVFTETELNLRIRELRQELAINKRNTSLYLNRKRSAPDSRISSMALGVVGIVVILTPVVLIILNDLSKCRLCKRSIKRI